MTNVLERIRNPQPRRTNWSRVVYAILLGLMAFSALAVGVYAWRGDWVRMDLAAIKGLVSWLLMEIYAVKAALFAAEEEGN